nr:MAG TPA: hypothetical protein [Microviridae sp.]
MEVFMSKYILPLCILNFVLNLLVLFSILGGL